MEPRREFHLANSAVQKVTFWSVFFSELKSIHTISTNKMECLSLLLRVGIMPNLCVWFVGQESCFRWSRWSAFLHFWFHSLWSEISEYKTIYSVIPTIILFEIRTKLDTDLLKKAASLKSWPIFLRQPQSETNRHTKTKKLLKNIVSTGDKKDEKFPDLQLRTYFISLRKCELNIAYRTGFIQELLRARMIVKNLQLSSSSSSSSSWSLE